LFHFDKKHPHEISYMILREMSLLSLVSTLLGNLFSTLLFITGLTHASLEASAAPQNICQKVKKGSKADRAYGALLGLAIGDALGTTLEFTKRDTYEPFTDIANPE
jgi:hypothetical protein